MTLGIDHLIHANVVCDDFDRSLDFYTRLLGEHGVPVVGGPVILTPMPGVRRHVATIRDPDGTLLTLVTPPLPEESGFSLPSVEVGDGQALPVPNARTISGKRFPAG